MRMTAKARALGMRHTSFRNASGLHDPRQQTTARDMAVLGRAMLRDHPRHYQRTFATQTFSLADRATATTTGCSASTGGWTASRPDTPDSRVQSGRLGQARRQTHRRRGDGFALRAVAQRADGRPARPRLPEGAAALTAELAKPVRHEAKAPPVRRAVAARTQPRKATAWLSAKPRSFAAGRKAATPRAQLRASARAAEVAKVRVPTPATVSAKPRRGKPEWCSAPDNDGSAGLPSS